MYRFDPGDGEYEDGGLTREINQIMRTLVPRYKYIDMTPLSFDRSGLGVQARTGDGFCQTWTLLFLKYFLKKKNKKTVVKMWSKMNSCELYEYMYGEIVDLLYSNESLQMQYIFNYFTQTPMFSKQRNRGEEDDDFINRMAETHTNPVNILDKVLQHLQNYNTKRR
jgi:hypothetical protein